MLNYAQTEKSGDIFWREAPVEIATDENIAAYGMLVDNHEEYSENSDSEGSIFNFWWNGNTLYGEDEADHNKVLLGWSLKPEEADKTSITRDQVLLSSVGYCTDAGQLYFPLRGEDYIICLAQPGDHIKPENFRSLLVTGGKGIYINPGIWHTEIIPMNERASFYKHGDTDNSIHINFTEKAGGFIVVPLKKIRRHLYH